MLYNILYAQIYIHICLRTCRLRRVHKTHRFVGSCKPLCARVRGSIRDSRRYARGIYTIESLCFFFYESTVHTCIMMQVHKIYSIVCEIQNTIIPCGTNSARIHARKRGPLPSWHPPVKIFTSYKNHIIATLMSYCRKKK